jgi:hypothetical protein
VKLLLCTVEIDIKLLLLLCGQCKSQALRLLLHVVKQGLKIACDFVKLKFEQGVFVVDKNILPNRRQVDAIEQGGNKGI